MFLTAELTSEMLVTAQNNSLRQTRDSAKSLKQRLSQMPGFLKFVYMRVLSNKSGKCDVDGIAESTSAECRFQSLPDEMLVEVFKNLDRKSLYNARATNSRCNGVILRNMRNSHEPITVSRLTITFVEETQMYKLAWCKYATGESKCRELFIALNDLNNPSYSLDFCFAQLEIQRLIIESMPKTAFNDRFVQFLCNQFQHCRDFKPLQLSIKNVDLSKLSSDRLKKLLTICAKRLEILEFFGIGNVASDLITDEHLLILEPNRVRRLSIQFKDYNNESPVDNLQVGDESLHAFMRLNLFPTFNLGFCSVTPSAVCEYVKEWLVIADKEDFMKCHSITLTDCPHVSNEGLEEELEQQGLNVIKRLDDNVNKFPFDLAGNNGKLVNYTVRLNKTHQEFIINLFTTTN